MCTPETSTAIANYLHTSVHAVTSNSLQPQGTRQASLFVGFSRQEYWSVLPCPTPGDLPNPGIEPPSPVFPALAGRCFTIKPHLGSPYISIPKKKINMEKKKELSYVPPKFLPIFLKLS